MTAMSVWLWIAVTCALAAIGMFFKSGQIAISHVSKSRLAAMQKAGNRRARILLNLLDRPEVTQTSLKTGRHLAGIAAASLTVWIMLDLAGRSGIVYAIFIIVSLASLVPDILTALIVRHSPEQFALSQARTLRLCVALLSPLAMMRSQTLQAIMRISGIGVGPYNTHVSATDALRGTVEQLHKGGSVEKNDRDMFGGLLDLKELTVSDVMIHRMKTFSVDIADGPGRIVQSVLAAPYTRVPLWRDTPENIIGIIHAKDLLRALDAAGNDPDKLDMEDIALPAWFVPDTTSLVEQLRAFRRRKMHFAFVVDEYGSVLGIVTLEDIIEEIVGDISDEHDIVVSGVRPQANGAVNVDGSVPIRDLNRFMDWNLPDEEATTIAGLVIHEARIIPDTGQIFTFYGYRFQVLRKQKNRIVSMRITPVATELFKQ